MAQFFLNSDIFIGNYRFSGVHEVHVRRSLKDFNDTATIRIPNNGMLQKGILEDDGSTRLMPGNAQPVNVRSLFKNNDPVVINLGYDGVMIQEFNGFVKSRGTGLICDIECEGWVRRMRLDVNVTGTLAKTNVSGLLKMISDQVPSIKVVVAAGADLPFINVKLINCNGVQICQEIKKLSQGALNIFFINYNTLWCGLVYTPYAGKMDPFGNGTVGYRRGWNCVHDNGLKEVTPTEPVQIIFNGTMANGKRIFAASELKAAVNKDKSLVNNVGSTAALQQMANEVQYKRNYTGYEGKIPGFLQPYCAPGYQVKIIDNTNPDLNGVYMCEGTEVRFGQGGAWRTVDIGHKLGGPTK